MENIKFSDVYPGVPEEERKEAAENLDRYLLLAWEIYREIEDRER